MEMTTPIIVKKGFFSTLAYGVCTVIVTAIICGTGVGIYGLRIVDRKSVELTSLAERLVASIPGIIDSLPPALSDAVNDRRDPDYRSQLVIDVRLADDGRGRSRPVIRVTNNGERTVSMLTLRVLLVDAGGAPTADRVVYAATPLAVDGQWYGPILPGETRTIAAREMNGVSRAEKVTYEVSDVRVWNGPGAEQASDKPRQND